MELIEDAKTVLLKAWSVHTALCVALWYSVFCRAVRSDRTVRLDVRLSMFLLGAVALLLVLAPFRWHWQPDWLTVLLLLDIVVVQGVTAAHWRRAGDVKGVLHG